MPARSRWTPRLLLAAGSLLVASLLAEVAVRLWLPPLQRDAMLIDRDGNRHELGGIIAWLRQNMHGGAGERAPGGALAPGLQFRIGYLPRSLDYFDADGCVPVRINSLGFRDEEFPFAKRPGELRILAVGDSFTFGQGLPIELTWTQQLERALAATRATPVEVVNAGFACPTAEDGIVLQMAHSPRGYADWVGRQGLALQPDLVLVGLCLNDLGPVPLLTYAVVPCEPVLGGWSMILDRAVHAVRQRAVRTAERPELPAMLDAIRRHPEWRATQDALVRMNTATAAAGVPLVVIVFPMLSQLDRYPLAPLHAMVDGFCAQNGIRCLDLMDAFVGAGINDEEFWVHPTDQHPNHRAAARIAERVREHLVAERLVGQ